MHGIDFSQVTPQRSSCTHLDSANGVNISCDLQNIDTLVSFRSNVFLTSEENHNAKSYL